MTLNKQQKKTDRLDILKIKTLYFCPFLLNVAAVMSLLKFQCLQIVFELNYHVNKHSLKMLCLRPPLSWLYQQVTLFYVMAIRSSFTHQGKEPAGVLWDWTAEPWCHRGCLATLDGAQLGDMIRKRMSGLFRETTEQPHALSYWQIALHEETYFYQLSSFISETLSSTQSQLDHPTRSQFTPHIATHCRAIRAPLEGSLPSWLSFPLVFD